MSNSRISDLQKFLNDYVKSSNHSGEDVDDLANFRNYVDASGWNPGFLKFWFDVAGEQCQLVVTRKNEILKTLGSAMKKGSK